MESGDNSTMGRENKAAIETFHQKRNQVNIPLDLIRENEESMWASSQVLHGSTESLSKLLLEQVKEQHLQIAEMRANEARHQSSIEDIKRSYNQELLRLQNLLAKRQDSRSSISPNDTTEEVEALGTDGNLTEAAGSVAREAELEKEVGLQNRLIEDFQRENEILLKANKELKQKLASTLIPAEDANAIAERLVCENARLQIDLQQVKDELRALKSSSSSSQMVAQTESGSRGLHEELEETKKTCEEGKRLNGALHDSLHRMEMELKEAKGARSHMQRLLSLAESKWEKEVRERQQRIATLTAELRQVRRDHAAAVQRVQEKVRWQTYTQSIAKRHVATIKKQKLEIMKLKMELDKYQEAQLHRTKGTLPTVAVGIQVDQPPVSTTEKHDLPPQESTNHSSPDVVKQLQDDLKAAYQQIDQLGAQLNALSKVHMKLVTGQPALVSTRCPDHDNLFNTKDASSAAYWQSIAEKRTKDVILLSRELDKLTALLGEISEPKTPPTNPSTQSAR